MIQSDKGADPLSKKDQKDKKLSTATNPESGTWGQTSFLDQKSFLISL